MPNIKETLTRPVGPLPAWGWVAVVVGGYFVYKFISGRGGSSDTATVVGTSTDQTDNASVAYEKKISDLEQQITDLQDKIKDTTPTPPRDISPPVLPTPKPYPIIVPVHPISEPTPISITEPLPVGIGSTIRNIGTAITAPIAPTGIGGTAATSGSALGSPTVAPTQQTPTTTLKISSTTPVVIGGTKKIAI